MFASGDAIRDALAALGSESRAGWSSAAQSAVVAELVEIADRVHAELLRAVGQWDAEACWAQDGAVTAPAWLSTRTSLSRAAAARMVRSARLVREHEATGAALATGAVSATQVDVIATITRNREDLYPDGEEALLRAAHTLTADGFAAAARHWRSLADDAVADQDAFAIHERRYLHASKTLWGTVRLDGELDLDGGETFLNALAAVDGSAVDDGRTGGQRNADNLVQIAAQVLRGEQHDAPAPPRASLIAGLDDLCDRAERAPFGARLELEHLGPVARSTALRLACDANVQRIIMSGASEVLDLGRTTPVVSRAQRRALAVRDRGCGFPGCDRPPSWCDAHHIWHWVKDGPTDLWNLVLLCRRHHVLSHEGGWHLARGPDGRLQVYRPDGSELVLAA